jgi:SAM-dependent methyltransferase
MVAGFSTSPPNQTLLEYAQRKRAGAGALRVLDIGCGAGRNAVPLARAGFSVLGTDLSWPMLSAALGRDPGAGVHVALAPMDILPVRDRSINLIVAHGIWNLARSGVELRRAIAEAARTAVAGAALFVFTFSRHTLLPDAAPVDGESFVFTQFSGSPQVFLTETELYDELRHAGFDRDPELPLREHNRPTHGRSRTAGPPVIYEAGFRFRGA